MTATQSPVTVRTALELEAEISRGATNIVLEGRINGMPSLTLPPGVAVSGGELAFLAKGLRLTRDNALTDITITTTPYEVAVYNDTSVPNAGTLTFTNVVAVGQVLIVAAASTRTVRVVADGLHVTDADTRGRVEQPHGYGVDVLQGGLTLWNRQPDPDSEFTATLRRISIGTEKTPVRGSGVFVAGYADREGKLVGGAFTADVIHTETVVIDGGIAPGTPDKISGGVFVVSGAIVDRVENTGPVTTHGQNDMVLDNWGSVTSWITTAPVTSTGPSGIGFVNFGDIDELDVRAPILTTGQGARGFNLYDGTLGRATFESIETTGDRSVGIQVSKPMGPLVVNGDIATTGGEGVSLVKGVQMPLKAIAVSIKPGGTVESISVGGKLSTAGPNVLTLEVGGRIGRFEAAAGVEATGEGSDAVHLVDGLVDLGDVDISSAHGRKIVKV